MDKNTVLIACDNEKEIITLETIFNHTENYTTELAKSKDGLLKYLKAFNKYDLIILNLQISIASNLNILTEIKKKFREQKVLLITSDRSKTPEIMLRGACDIIFKPYDKFDLLHHVDDSIHEKRLCKRFELKDCDIDIVLLNKDGVRINGSVNNICMDGVLIDIEDLTKAESFFNDSQNVDVLYQPSNSKPMVKIFRGNVVRVYQDRNKKGKIAVYLTPGRDVYFLDDFVSFFKINLDLMR